MATFSQLFNPTGIATDLSGNVFVNSSDFGGLFLTKFSPSGSLLDQIRVPFSTSVPISIPDKGSLALDSSSGIIYNLVEDGTLVAIDPNTLATNTVLNLRDLPIDNSHTYDLASQTIGGQGGLVVPGFAKYGDLAILNGNGFKDFYITGLSTAVPFVMRLRSTEAGLDASVLLASVASAAGTNNIAPGIAVNAQGTVVTDLPINFGTLGTEYSLVTFPFNLDLRQPVAAALPRFLNPNLAVSSKGMTTDAAGNFWIGTNAVGSTISDAGSVLVLSADLSQLIPVISGGLSLSTPDVAISIGGDRLYTTSSTSAISVFPLSAATSQSLDSQELARAILSPAIQEDSIFSKSRQIDELMVQSQAYTPVDWLKLLPTTKLGKSYEVPLADEWIRFNSSLKESFE